MFGTCLDCSRLNRMDVPAEQRIGALFDIDLAKLIAERGASASCIDVEPILCPRRGGRRTETRVITSANPS